ncbi:unnamed protein product [Phytophthora fragariaefolia]|uniref:Unnamed protein product n=1 Tax=Phytophthora fragariaefolia TaxID=1490495 RepID=A0A9W7CSE5_9STRA|nr:unnamed protein product [Phytophthora fragariaefolia]
MSTPTTQAAGMPAASAAANTVVASSTTTGSSLASTPVVTSTVTTPSSPKRMMSLGKYKKTRGNALFARDELEALFDVGSDADMENEEEEEEEEGTSSLTRVGPSMRSHRPREDDSDASSSKRSRSGSDRPLADAGPLSMEATPLRPYALYSCSGIKDDDVTKELDFDPATDQRRDYYIGLFHELRWHGNKKTSPRERYERFSKCPKIERLHPGAVEAGIPCAVPVVIACEHCHVGALRVSERDINGYTGVRVPEELKTLRTNLIAQMASSAAGGLSTLPRAVGDYSSRSSLRPSAALVVAGFEILSNEYENDRDLGSGSDDQQLAGRSSELPPVRLAVGVATVGRRRGSGPQDSVDRREAVERLQMAEFAALRQGLALVKAQLAQVSQTPSNVQVDLGSKLAVLRTRVGALEQASAPSHQD